jgi:uncharacterized protein (TIGR02757 family)
MYMTELLHRYADEFESKEFLNGDPSWFMHQVSGVSNQELFAFIASSLSYGSRKQFFPKIQYILDCSHGDVDSWIRTGSFERDVPDNNKCYYRLYTNHTMHQFLSALHNLIIEYGTLGDFIKGNSHDGYSAIVAITAFFGNRNIETIIPKGTDSACKRICMFLRWMVRDNSPVDLGLWTFIDKRTLIMPLDTHVLQEACALGLLNSRSASMSAAKKLTAKMLQIFPDDPLKGDFALFGSGVAGVGASSSAVDNK